MFGEQNIIDVVEIHPSELHRKWKDRVLQTLKKQQENTVTEKYGAITKVNKIVRVIDHPRSCHDKLLAKVECQVQSFKPCKGEVYRGKITLVLQIGLLIEENNVRVIIRKDCLPSPSLSTASSTAPSSTSSKPHYTFDAVRKCFTNGISSYSQGDSVSFLVLDVRYCPTELNCIGSIKDLPQITASDDDVILEPEDTFESVEEETSEEAPEEVVEEN
jgi:DNA-directed RNA polymerase subunit E'/Rpb7